MRFIILGKNSDDKGTQLEQLTQTMLEHQGFTNLIPNKQESGGNEIDVSAEKILQQVGGKPMTIPVICECKAHNNAITLPDWLKFLGKLYIARLKKQNTIGLMISLSGANGSVMGSLEKDFSGDENVQLIAGDTLKSILSEIYELPAPSALRDRLQNEASLIVEDVSPVYYGKKAYWLITFENGGYTLYSGKGEYLDKNKVKKLLPLIEKETSYKRKDYIDINELRNHKLLEARLKVFLLRDCVNNTTVSVEEFRKESEQVGLEISDLKSFFENCTVLKYDEESETISLCGASDSFLIDFYKTIYSSDQVPIELMSSDFYKNHIDDSFLEIIKKTQFGLQLPSDYKEKILFILQYSPSALLYSLTPDPILQSNRLPFMDEGMKRLYQSHFISQLSEAFRADFTNQRLSRFYFNSGINHMTIKTFLSYGDNDSMEVLETNRNFVLAEIQGTNQVGVLVAKNEDDNQ